MFTDKHTSIWVEAALIGFPFPLLSYYHVFVDHLFINSNGHNFPKKNPKGIINMKLVMLVKFEIIINRNTVFDMHLKKVARLNSPKDTNPKLYPGEMLRSRLLQNVKKRYIAQNSYIRYEILFSPVVKLIN